MTNEFDVNSWKEKGEKAYSELCEKEEGLRKELEDVVEEKAKLGQLLGKGSSQTSTRRVQIKRPVLTELSDLREKEYAEIEVEAFITLVVDANPELDEKRVRSCLRDMHKAEELAYTDEEQTAIKL